MRDDDLREAAPRPADEEVPDAEPHGDGEAQARSSLADDVLSLIEDGRTYAEAELNYQKSRIVFVASRSKSIALYIAFALGFIHLALVALVIGSLFVLVPLVGAAGATGLVVGLLLLGAAALSMLARTKARDVADAFKEDGA